MSLFKVDSEKCTGDGLCVSDCPLRIIEFSKEGSVPVPAAHAEELCISCGHCVAVCPNSAFSHRSMTPEECLLVRPEWALNPEQVEHFLRARRSIRSYKKEDVDRQLIDRLVRTARFAPSGHNAQPVRWTVWYRRKDVEHLAGLVIDWMRHLIAQGEPLAETLHMDRTVGFWEAGRDTICRGAPHMIVAHAPESERTAPPACTIALAYLELAAPSLGLGTCWAGYFTAAANLWPPMKAALELPEGHICFGAVMVGYPRYGYHRLPLRNEPPITWR